MDLACGETAAANVQIHCSKYLIVQIQQSKKKFLAYIKDSKIIAFHLFSVEEILLKDWQHILQQNFLTNYVNGRHAIPRCFARIQARKQCVLVLQICWVYTQSSRILYTPLDLQTSSFFSPNQT